MPPALTGNKLEKAPVLTQNSAPSRKSSVCISTRRRWPPTGHYLETFYRQVYSYVHVYKILQENYDAGKGLYRVKIAATVHASAIEDALDDLYPHVIPGSFSSPRVILNITQIAPAVPADIAQKELSDELVNLGFTVVDARRLNGAERQALHQLWLRDDLEVYVASKTLQESADIVIHGQVEAGQAEAVPDDAGVYACKASCELLAFSTMKAEVIAAKRGMANGVNFTAAGAEEVAMKNAVKAWREKNIGLLVRAAVDPCREYLVNLSGCSREQVATFETELAKSPFVRTVTQLSFENGVAMEAIQYQGSGKKLCKEILTLKGLRLAIESLPCTTIHAHPYRLR